MQDLQANWDVQGTAAFIAAINVIGNASAPPRLLKKMLSMVAINLTQVLSPKTIAMLVAQRDRCIRDCGLSAGNPSPAYLSMINGLGVDAPLLQFSKTALRPVHREIFAGYLVEIAKVRTQNLLPLPEAPLTRRGNTWTGYYIMKLDAPLLGVSNEDLNTWIGAILAVGGLPKYTELAETAGALAGFLPPRIEFFGPMYLPEFTAAIAEARRLIKAQDPVDQTLDWVFGASGDLDSVLGQKEELLEGSPLGNGLIGSVQEGERGRAMEGELEQGESDDGAEQGQSEMNAGGGQEPVLSEEVASPTSNDLTVLEKQSAPAKQEGLRDRAAESGAEPQSSGLSGQQEQGQVGEDNAEGSESASRGSQGQSSAPQGQPGRSWAGLYQYFADLMTGQTSDKERVEKQGDIEDDSGLPKARKVDNKRTWAGLLSYFCELVKNILKADK
jgi:hypothetical protein